MKENKRILMVADMIFYPPNQGNRRRIYNFIKLMQEKGYTVDYLFYSLHRCENWKEMQDILKEGKFIFFRLKKNKPSMWAPRWKMLGRFAPPNRVDDFYLGEVDKKIQTILEKKEHSVLWLEYMIQSKSIENLKYPITTVIDTHDRFSWRNFRMYPFSHANTGFSPTYLGERKALKRADYVIAIQKQEGVFFEKLLRGTKTKIVTIGDNHEIIKNEVKNNHNICFIGSDNKLNIDAINWFIQEVFPLITYTIKDCKLLVVGKVCKVVQPLNENIECLGLVDDLDEVYANCRLVVNPVRGGTGLNIKSIEAIAHCKPLVCTTVGAKGIKYNKLVLDVADDKNLFAQKVIQLLEDDLLCQQFQENCFEYMKRYNNRNREELGKILK